MRQRKAVLAVYALKFVNETGDTVRAMAEACIRALQGERVTAAGDFTKGHYKRGVE